MDYRDLILAEFKRRKIANPRYSMRSFAELLKLSPAFLSKLLRGQKNLSMDRLVEIADILGFNETETHQFCQMAQVNKSRNPRTREALSDPQSQEPDQEYFPLSLESFQVISDWFHYAILELSNCQKKDFESGTIAERLGISVQEAETALNRLLRLGLLKNSKGMIVKSKAHLSMTPKAPNQAVRNFHQQMIEKAKLALETQSLERREISGSTLAISADKLEIARREIRTFRRRMARLLDSSNPTDVYQLNVQFFALSTPPKENPRSKR